MATSFPAVFKVTQDWQASFIDPIELKAGEQAFLNGKSDIWDGHKWLWAENQAGKHGWIPDTLCLKRDGKSFSARDYSAHELTCLIGQVLLVDEITHGWAWARPKEDRRVAHGWVPLRNLEIVKYNR